MIAYSLPLEPDVAQSILEETDVAARSLLVLDELRNCIGSGVGRPSVFPPPYSLN